MPTLPLDGGCHCGALRFRISEAPLMVYNCHCTNCRKISSSAFATPATVPTSGFAFTRGEPARIEWKADSGSTRFGWFCAKCGSRIAHGQVENSRSLSLRSGTLDDPSWAEPVGDIWVRSKLSWVDIPEGRIVAMEQPTDYSPFMQRFAARTTFITG